MSAKVELPPKICEWEPCSKEYTRRENEPTNKFKKRRFCSVDCRQASAIAKTRKAAEEKKNNTPPKPCAICNELFYRREGEQLFRFKMRQTCKEGCAKVLRRVRSGVGVPNPNAQPKKPPRPNIRVVRHPRKEPPTPEEISQLPPPVRWVPPPTPTSGRQSIAVTSPQAENLTQAQRTERRIRFRESFQEAS